MGTRVNWGRCITSCQRQTKPDSCQSGKDGFESVLTMTVGKSVQCQLNTTLVCTEVTGPFKGRMKEWGAVSGVSVESGK